MSGRPPFSPDPDETGVSADAADLLPDPLDDAELRDFAREVREALQERLSEGTRELLRARLMAAAVAPQAAGAQPSTLARWSRLGGGDRRPVPSRPAARPRTRGRSPMTVLRGAPIGALAALATVLVAQYGAGAGSTARLPEQVQPVAASFDTGILGLGSGEPGDPLTVKFDQPLDRASVQAAMRLHPATTFTSAWSGDELKIIPRHGFAPGTAYVLTIDGRKARTAAGAPLRSDLRVVFGTAPAVRTAVVPMVPFALARTALDESAVAVQRAIRVPAATAAMGVSRSGRSVAFLGRSGAATQIVMADAAGVPQNRFAVDVDLATPLGWIEDRAVVFVAAGRLRAIDRAGRVSTLSDLPVDPRHDTVVVAPGGGHVFLAHGSGSGAVLDLHGGRTRSLSHVEGVPTFSACGATVVWVERHGSALHLNVGPAGGEPATSIPLDVAPGERVSDLAVSPDASLLAYSVSRPGRSALLRLAVMPTGETLAESSGGVGRAPVWAPTGRFFTVLTPEPGGGTRVERVDVPPSVPVPSPYESVAQAFVNAQLDLDVGAQRALATSSAALPAPPRANRATVLWVDRLGADSATVRVRLQLDPTVSDPIAREVEETLTLVTDGGTGTPRIAKATLGPLAVVDQGPGLLRVDRGQRPGVVRLAFDSDLDPRSAQAGVVLATSGGARVATSSTYDARTRTVEVRAIGSAAEDAGQLNAVVTVALRDVSGATRSLPLTVTVSSQG